MEAAATTNRPSALPRPSRLPTFTKRSQVASPTSEIPPSYRPAAATPKLQKRASLAGLARAAHADLKDAQPTTNGASKDTASKTRPGLPLTSSRVGATPKSGTLRGLTRPSSRGNQQRIPPPFTAKPHRAEDEENHDQLSSLNSFRAASRQGFHDDESPVEYEEPPQLAMDDFRPRDRTKSRPSLSERTMESLQGMPSTPKDRRRSSFFTPLESPMGPPARPGSALSRNSSHSHSRPGTSDGLFAKPARPVSPAKRPPLSARPPVKTGSFGFTPASAKRRSVSTAFGVKLPSAREAPKSPRSPSPNKRPGLGALANGKATPRPLNGSKTLAARPTKARPALGDAFAPLTAATPKAPTPFKRAVSGGTNASSAALREQIAAAKAAARKEKAKGDSPQQNGAASFEPFGGETQADPFNLAPKDGKHILRNRIKSAWTDGKLNIAGLGLSELPDEVLNMYDAKAMEDGKVNWAEVVDLIKLIAADNEFQELPDRLFPDKVADDFAEDDEGQGNPFGGLEMIDLHGNSLQAMPLGLRRLERLTSLNLTHNKLDNSCLDIVSQVHCLRELRLGHNNLSGNLPSSICGLSNLETLDVQANRLLGLPEALRELVSLRVLNVAGNQLTAVPIDALQQIQLFDLNASSNALIGSLFPLGGMSAHATLQTLNVANNSLAALTFAGDLDLPHLRTLDVTNNHFTSLPSVSGWTELITLTAGDNKISELPDGFASLRKLKTVNLTSNELRLLDPEVSRMEGLEVLVLSANPLRERKYLTTNAADIKRDLASKLDPDVGEDGDVHESETVVGLAGTVPSGSVWSVSSNGLLDLSSRHLADDINDRLGSVLRNNEVRELRLQGNNLTVVPPALWLGQDLRILDLSNNSLAEDYFSAELELPALQELNISHCRLSSLEPPTSQLVAPALRVLNVAANRLTGTVPTLRDAFPALKTLYASGNKFSTVTAHALQGLQTVDLGSNDLQGLPAELGLLWDEGLKSLEVGSNAFRVPNYRTLDKGTEATLRWLRDKLPAGDSRVVEEFA